MTEATTTLTRADTPAILDELVFAARRYITVPRNDRNIE